eukprot:1182138-Alexandrium_andersonii.AAC.1
MLNGFAGTEPKSPPSCVRRRSASFQRPLLPSMLTIAYSQNSSRPTSFQDHKQGPEAAHVSGRDRQWLGGL